MTGPLTRRRLLASLDEDTASAWTPSQLASFEDAARRSEKARDRRKLLAAYTDSEITSPCDAFRAFVHELRERRGS